MNAHAALNAEKSTETTLSVVVQSALLSDPSAPQNIESLLNWLQKSSDSLSLSHLRRWLSTPSLQGEAARVEASLQIHPDSALSSCTDKALAQCLGLNIEDGLMPWAWHHLQTQSFTKAQPMGVTPMGDQLSPIEDSSQGFAMVSLSNWHVASGQVIMQPPRAITQAESTQVLNTLRPYFVGDGIELFEHTPGTWIARSPLFKDLPSACLERVMGQDVNPWLIGRTAKPHQQKAIHTLRRLQSEVQMLLYHHPINETNASPLNSIWYSATGQAIDDWPKAIANPWSHETEPLKGSAQDKRLWLQTKAHTALWVEDLNNSHLNLDLSSWCEAFEKIDEEIFSQLPQIKGVKSVEVVFCGLNYSKHWKVVTKGHAPTPTHTTIKKPNAWWNNLPSFTRLWRPSPSASGVASSLEDLLI